MIGKYSAKLDEKNRLFVPSKLRGELGENFFVTLGVNCGHRCLTVYTAEEWQTLSHNYNSLSISPDKQFRFALTPFLLQYAGIDREVMIVGRAGQAEIWDAEEFAAFEAENLTPEKLLASLEAIGL